MVLPPLIRTVLFLPFLGALGESTIASKTFRTVNGICINCVKIQTHMEIQIMGRANTSWRHVWGKTDTITAFAMRNRKQGYHPMIPASEDRKSSSSSWLLKAGLWLRESLASDRMTKGSWMTLPRLEQRLNLRFLSVLSGEVETGENEPGEEGLGNPEPLALLPAWILSLLGHDTRDRLSDNTKGILPGITCAQTTIRAVYLLQQRRDAVVIE